MFQLSSTFTVFLKSGLAKALPYFETRGYECLPRDLPIDIFPIILAFLAIFFVHAQNFPYSNFSLRSLMALFLKDTLVFMKIILG